MLVLATVYAISPVDIVTDAAPVVGWIDDVFIISMAIFNTLQKASASDITWLSKIAKALKWTTILVGIVVVGLILLLGATIVTIIHNW